MAGLTHVQALKVGTARLQTQPSREMRFIVAHVTCWPVHAVGAKYCT